MQNLSSLGVDSNDKEKLIVSYQIQNFSLALILYWHESLLEESGT